MRLSTFTMLAVASSALGLSACTQPATTSAAPREQTGSVQPAQPQGGVTFQAGQGPGQVAPPPVGAYTGSERGSNSPLGVTFRDPANPPPVGAYTGSQRGYSNSPLGFQRNPSEMPGSQPIEQSPVRR